MVADTAESPGVTSQITASKSMISVASMAPLPSKPVNKISQLSEAALAEPKKKYSKLLNLPQELQDQISEYALYVPGGIKFELNTGCKVELPAYILSCKRIYKDTIKMFYAINDFIFEVTRKDEPWTFISNGSIGPTLHLFDVLPDHFMTKLVNARFILPINAQNCPCDESHSVEIHLILVNKTSFAFQADYEQCNDRQCEEVMVDYITARAWQLLEKLVAQSLDGGEVLKQIPCGGLKRQMVQNLRWSLQFEVDGVVQPDWDEPDAALLYFGEEEDVDAGADEEVSDEGSVAIDHALAAAASE